MILGSHGTRFVAYSGRNRRVFFGFKETLPYITFISHLGICFIGLGRRISKFYGILISDRVYGCINEENVKQSESATLLKKLQLIFSDLT